MVAPVKKGRRKICGGLPYLIYIAAISALMAASQLRMA